MRQEDEDKTIYRLLVNHEEQYCIWAARKPIPLGWHDVGRQPALKDEILAFVKEVWTDMRPLSVRKRAEEFNRVAEPEKRVPSSQEPSQTS
jgi:MbtH protein